MKKTFLLAFLVLLPSIACATAFPASAPYQVCFTPGGNCTSEIVSAISDAKHSIFVQAYSFTSAPIADALDAAKQRGVDVEVILDKSQAKGRYHSASDFVSDGIPTWIDYKPAIAHNKVMIIDGATVITGSFNFTKAAQYRNAENILIIRDAGLAAAYKQNWEYREMQSRKLG